MLFKKPVIGPTIRHKSVSSLEIVIHGTNKYNYGYILLFNDNVSILLSTLLDENSHYGHRFIFDNLDEDTEYKYQVGITKKASQDTDNLGTKVYTTKTLSSNNYKFALGSCRFYANIYGYLSIGNNLSDAPFKQIKKHDLDSMYIIGDHPYMDCIKELSFIRLKNRGDIFKNHITARSTKGFKSVASMFNVQEVPDDHEYRDNGDPVIGEDEPEVYRNAIDGINVFQIHSGPHQYGANVPYWKYEDLNVCEIFICDTRYERTEDRMMSDEQIGTLLTKLSNKIENKPFLIFTPVPFVLAQHGDDMWCAYSDEQNIILNHIKNNDIRNVFILSGDSHISVTSAYDFYEDNTITDNKIVEIMSSPLYQIAHDVRSSILDKYTIDDNNYLLSSNTLDNLRKSVIRVNNYAVIDVNPDKLIVTYYRSSNGKQLNEVTYDYW